MVVFLNSIMFMFIIFSLNFLYYSKKLYRSNSWKQTNLIPILVIISTLTHHFFVVYLMRIYNLSTIYITLDYLFWFFFFFIGCRPMIDFYRNQKLALITLFINYFSFIFYVLSAYVIKTWL